MINRIGIIYLKHCNQNERLYLVFLENIRKMFNRLIVACDTPLEYEGRKLLEPFTKEIIVENLDSGKAAWKLCCMEYLTEEERNSCDELTLISLDFLGLIKDCEKLVSAVNDTDADVINFCPFDLNGDSCPELTETCFLILKKRVLEDYSFGKFLQGPESEGALEVFGNSGFKCLNYAGSEELFILPQSRIRALPIGIGNQELKSRIKSFIDMVRDSDGARDGLVRNLAANNSTESMRNLYDLDFILEGESGIISEEDFTLCMFIETQEGLDKAVTIIRNADKKWNIRIWLREEDFLEQIMEEQDLIKADLFYRECMWEKVVEAVEECQSSLIGFVFENGDMVNFQDNFENLFMNGGMVAQLQHLFAENKYMAAVLPKKYISTDRFIRNEVYRLQLQEIPEFQDIPWDIEMPECALCCRTTMLKKCIHKADTESAREEEALSWCETESVKIIPHLLQMNGYMVGHAICDRNVLAYGQRLNELSEKQIRSYVKSGRLAVTDFNEYLGEVNSLLKGYYTLYDRVKRLEREKKALLGENNELKRTNGNFQVKEVPVLVDIGVKQATKNWVKKHMGREQSG